MLERLSGSARADHRQRGTAKRRDLRYWHKADIPELTLQCPLLGVKRLHPLTVAAFLNLHRVADWARHDLLARLSPR